MSRRTEMEKEVKNGIETSEEDRVDERENKNKMYGEKKR